MTTDNKLNNVIEEKEEVSGADKKQELLNIRLLIFGML